MPSWLFKMLVLLRCVFNCRSKLVSSPSLSVFCSPTALSSLPSAKRVTRLYHRHPIDAPSTFPIYYNDVYEVNLPKGHRFPMQKYRKVREKVQSTIIGSREEGDEKRKVECDFRVSPLATKEQVTTTHDPNYVTRYLSGDMTDSENRNIGFPWSLQHVNRTLSSVGGTVAAACAAWEEYLCRNDYLQNRNSGQQKQQQLQHITEENKHLCWAAHVAGGTHHAFFDYGEGFCIFSDIAVAANVLLKQYSPSPRRILIIDLDVHQGNGNAALFADNNQVKTFSMHCKGNYFSKKEVGDLDIELPIDCDDKGYLQNLQLWLNRIEEHEFDDDHISTDDTALGKRKQFDLIFFQSGVDIHVEDRLGRLCVSQAGISKRNEIVFDFADKLKVPLVISMGGGYPEENNWSPIIEAHAGVYIQAYQYILKKSQ